MSPKIVLSPEISSVVRELMQIETVFLKSEENKIKSEELLKQILSMLPRGIIGFTYNGRVYLREQIVQSLLELEEFSLLPDEEEPKETKEK